MLLATRVARCPRYHRSEGPFAVSRQHDPEPLPVVASAGAQRSANPGNAGGTARQARGACGRDGRAGTGCLPQERRSGAAGYRLSVLRDLDRLPDSWAERSAHPRIGNSAPLQPGGHCGHGLQWRAERTQHDSRLVGGSPGTARHRAVRRGQFSFFLDPDIPYVVGAHAELVIDRLVAGAGLRRSDIRHWLVHSGGKKVIDAITVNLRLTHHDMRHTIGVLRDYGNLSSGSFLFSYQRLVNEDVAQPGDYGVLMTMGPGSTIEAGLIQW